MECSDERVQMMEEKWKMSWNGTLYIFMRAVGSAKMPGLCCTY